MKKLLLLTTIILLSLQIYAQAPAAAKGNNAMANMGHIYGKITDSSGKAVAEASVLLMKSTFDSASKKKKEILVKGLTTKSNGEFSIEDLPVFGNLTLKVSAVGFKAHQQQISFMPAGGGNKPAGSAAPTGMPGAMPSFDKDLGNIQLNQDVTQLQNVTVTATSSAMKLDIDKKVFNVEKNIVSAGGTALDVMRNVPSVQVDIDGNVKLRNATPQIYIDGRPTTLTLDQIPSDAIENVEVITNPSAKYDASGGSAGILNIVLKKNKKTGYNGNIMAGVDKRGAVNGGGNFSLRQGKFNISAAVMANQMKNRTNGTTKRYNQGDTATYITQNNSNKTNGGFMFGRLGADYFMTNRTTLSLSATKVHGEFKPGETIDVRTDSLFNSSKVSSYSQRISNSERTFNAGGLQLGFKHNFAKEGEELTADANYFGGKNEGNAMYTTNYYDSPSGGTVNGTQYQKVLSDGKNQFLTIQTDYVKPFKGNSKLEAGLRAQFRKTTSNNNTYIQYIDAPDYIKIPAAASNYKNSDDVYAAYVSVTSSIKDFGYKLGLRAESSDYNGELTNLNQKFSNKYPISLFPSLFLSQKLKNKQELQLSYTRRINRPNFFQLIPYTDYTDSLNITKGNPNLVPEFTNSIEFSYSKTFKGNNNILASLYYKHTDNLITRYLQTDINPVTGQEDKINTYVNANSSYSTGAEITSINYLAKWWDITTNINIYNSKINTDNISGTSQDALWSWFGKFNNNFKLPKNFSIQLSADYQSKTNLPVNNQQGFGPPMSQAQASSQGYIKSFWGMDAAIRKSFLKNNAATVTFSASDIFGTRKSDQVAYGDGFVQDYYRLTNPHMFKLMFTYRFGKMDASLFKRQSNKSSEGMQGATQGMQ